MRSSFAILLCCLIVLVSSQNFEKNKNIAIFSGDAHSLDADRDPVAEPRSSSSSFPTLPPESPIAPPPLKPEDDPNVHSPAPAPDDEEDHGRSSDESSSPPPESPPPESPPPPPPPPQHLPKATLASLNISGAGKLSPEFRPDTFNYSASVSSGVQIIRIVVTISHDEEEEEYAMAVNSIPLKSGFPSPRLQVGKPGEDAFFEIAVTALEHEPAAYYLVVHRGKSKWDRFGAKFLLVLAIVLVLAVICFLCYGCYVCIKSGTIPSIWPFKSRDRDEYSLLRPGPSNSRP